MNKDFIASELIKIAKLIVKADDLSPKQEEYQQHFKDTMEEHGVDSPNDFESEEDKKDFFDDVDEGWDAENEND